MLTSSEAIAIMEAKKQGKPRQGERERKESTKQLKRSIKQLKRGKPRKESLRRKLQLDLDIIHVRDYPPWNMKYLSMTLKVSNNLKLRMNVQYVCLGIYDGVLQKEWICCTNTDTWTIDALSI